MQILSGLRRLFRGHGYMAAIDKVSDKVMNITRRCARGDAGQMISTMPTDLITAFAALLDRTTRATVRTTVCRALHDVPCFITIGNL